jgi:hypothetical protein
MEKSIRILFIYITLVLISATLLADQCLASSPLPLRVLPLSRHRRVGILASIDSTNQYVSTCSLSKHTPRAIWWKRAQKDKRTFPSTRKDCRDEVSFYLDTSQSSKRKLLNNILSDPLRAGGASAPSSAKFPPLETISTVFGTIEQILKVVIESMTTIGMIVLPPTTFIVRSVYKFYNKLPHDAIMAQAGLVYCFAGGYFPTLFAAMSAAQNSGMSIIFQALSDLVDEGSKAIDACINDEIPSPSTSGNAPYWNEERTTFVPFEELSPHKRFGRKTRIVLATVDPVKINTALGALYATWLGVSAVLEKQFARTISLSLTIAEYMYPIISFLVSPPFRLLIPNDLHRWVPLIVGWGCKALAMSVAWKLQRILSATTSAIAGGFMFSRHLLRMIFRRSRMAKKDRLLRSMKLKSTSPTEIYDDNDVTLMSDDSTTVFDEIIGLAIAGLGLWTQIGNGFSFQLPFPLNYIFLPFTIAENWIQWQITKKAE